MSFSELLRCKKAGGEKLSVSNTWRKNIYISILHSSIIYCIGRATSRQAACLAGACAVLASCFRAVRLALFTTKYSFKLKTNENRNFVLELDHVVLFHPFLCSVAKEGADPLVGASTNLETCALLEHLCIYLCMRSLQLLF